MPYSLQAFAFESLLTSAKMTQMMDNDEQLKATIIGSHTGGYTYANSGHTHNGSNSALIESLGNNTVTQANLSTADSEVTTTTSAHLVLAGGAYSFYPRLKKVNAGSGIDCHITDPGASYVGSTSYVSIIYLSRTGVSDNVYAISKYIQASPPYKIGDVTWGHFVFMVRNKSNGEIISAYSAEDPPWAYNGVGKKDSPERIAHVPHPFPDYYNGIPDHLEICLINGKEPMINWNKELKSENRGMLESMNKIKIGKVNSYSNFNVPEIPGFTNKVIIREASLLL